MTGNKVIKVHFGSHVPQVHWVDVATGQLSFVYDVPSHPPGVAVSETVGRRPRTLDGYAARSHDAMAAREG